jgi:uncharacterized protein with FMN-binding domain
MKRKTRTVLLIVALVLLACAAAGVIAFQVIQRNLNALSSMKVEDIPLDRVKDGVYTGEYGVFPVSAQVEVTVKDHAILSARIIRHRNGQGSAGEAVVNKAAEAGSLQVDTVAGATYSSKVLLFAMENALRKGLSP